MSELDRALQCQEFANLLCICEGKHSYIDFFLDFRQPKGSYSRASLVNFYRAQVLFLNRLCKLAEISERFMAAISQKFRTCLKLDANLLDFSEISASSRLRFEVVALTEKNCREVRQGLLKNRI